MEIRNTFYTLCFLIDPMSLSFFKKSPRNDKVYRTFNLTNHEKSLLFHLLHIEKIKSIACV